MRFGDSSPIRTACQPLRTECQRSPPVAVLTCLTRCSVHMSVSFSLADTSGTGRLEILSVHGALDAAAVASLRARLAPATEDAVVVDLSPLDQLEAQPAEALAAVVA